MKLAKVFAFLTIGFSSLLAQDGDLNMRIVAHVPAPEGGSGIWHFVDKNGIEYAAIGLNNALVVYSLEDPSKPIERHRVRGVSTIWREVFIYGNYIYGVTDNRSDGIIIINMNNAPGNISHKFWTTQVTAANQTDSLTTCHTVFVDEKGILSLNGCRPWQGVLFFDLNVDPENPKFIGSETKRYCHDNFVRNDTMFSSDINNGLLSIWDVKDQMNPKELATITTPFAFTHNSWPSDDGKYIFTTDERANAYLAAYDISDLNDIRLLDQWRPKDTEGTGVIPHNTRYLNGYLITSYYTDGVKIVDAHKPDNLIEVGSVDTYFGNQMGFHGCWGVSPYLPSGLIVASDIEGGLFVIEADYKRACYLEGTVMDSITKEKLANVSVVLKIPRTNGEQTDLKGGYKTGYANAGTYEVEFTHPDYLPKIVSIQLDHGVVSLLDVELVKRSTISQKVIVKEFGTLKEIENAQVVFINPNRSIEATTMMDGSATVSILQDIFDYQVVAGKWGFLHNSVIFDSRNPQGEIVVLLEKGYQDDFIFDQDWTIETTATSGAWERAVPLGTSRQGQLVQTDKDVDGDYGNQCYVTGNGSSDPSGDDIDNGETLLLSPSMDLSTYQLPLMNFQYWFTNTGGSGNPNDSISIYLFTNSDTVLILSSRQSSPNWMKVEKLKINDFVTDLTNVRLAVVAGDYNPGHLVEAALDEFLIVEGMPVANDEQSKSLVQFSIVPNYLKEASEVLLLANHPLMEEHNIEIIDINGKIVEKHKFKKHERNLMIGSKLRSGLHIVQINSGSGYKTSLKLLVL